MNDHTLTPEDTPCSTPEMADGGFALVGGKNFSFAQAIEHYQKTRLFTIFEMREKTRHPSRSIERWKSGQTMPSDRVQRAFIQAMEQAGPSARERNDAFKNHNLTWDQSKRRWKCRVTTLSEDEKRQHQVGVRVDVPIRTSSLEIAIVARDSVISALRKRGYEVELRKQKRKGDH